MSAGQSIEFKSEFIKQLALGINICRIYPKGHPSLEPVVQRIKLMLKELPLDQETISVVVIEDVLMIGDDRFDSKRLPLVKSLVERFTRLGVKSITFDVNASEEEIRTFFLAMAATPADIADYGDIVALVRSRGVLSIKINKYRVGVVSSDEEVKQLDWTNFLESLVISHHTWTDEDRIKQLGSFLAGIGVLGNESTEVQTQKVISGLERLAGIIADQYGEERWDEYAVIFSRMLAVLSPTIKKNIARYKTENKKLAFLFKSLIPTMSDEDIIDIIAAKAKERGPQVEDEVVDILKNITGTRLPDILSSIRVNIPEINFEKIVARLMSEMKATKGADVADKIIEKNLEQQMRSYFPNLRDPSAEVRIDAIKKLMQLSNKIFEIKNFELARLLVDRFDALSDTEEDISVFRVIMDSIKELYTTAQRHNREEIIQFISKKFSKHLVRKEKSLLEKKHIVIKTVAEIKDHNYVPELISLLWDQGSYVEAREALIAMADYSIPMLIDTLKDAEDKGVRMKILDVLVHMGEKVIPAAIELLSSPEWYIRRNGLYILGELKAVAALEHIGQLVGDSDERVQYTAIECLNKIDGERIYEFLKTGLKSRHRSVVILAMKLLPRADVKDRLSEVSNWIKQRKAIPDEKEEQFRRSVIEVLGEKGDDSVVDNLLEVLEERALFKNEVLHATKIAALNALYRIGTPKAIEVLKNISNQKDSALASVSRELLRRKESAGTSGK
ncbi:MAG: HEAT repeat domain-containing protein [candidate division WOR-3 bacterium]|nr:HEAT repeat domain-containing protein [candidate division WOR-3 bacterium]